MCIYNGGFENWNMILVENYPCETNLELLARERYHVEQLNATLNQRKPGRTAKQFYQENKETIIAKVKIYSEANKEAIRAQHAVQIECECGVTYTHGHQSRHKTSKKHNKFINQV